MISYVDTVIGNIKGRISLEDVVFFDTSIQGIPITRKDSVSGTNHSTGEGKRFFELILVDNLSLEDVISYSNQLKRWYNFILQLANSSYFVTNDYLNQEVDKFISLLEQKIEVISLRKKVAIDHNKTHKKNPRYKQTGYDNFMKRCKIIIRMLNYTIQTFNDLKEIGRRNTIAFPKKDNNLLYSELERIAQYWLKTLRIGSITDAYVIIDALFYSTLKDRKAEIITFDMHYKFLLNKIFGETILHRIPEKDFLYQFEKRDILKKLRNCDVTIFYQYHKTNPDGSLRRVEYISTREMLL